MYSFDTIMVTMIVIAGHLFFLSHSSTSTTIFDFPFSIPFFTRLLVYSTDT